MIPAGPPPASRTTSPQWCGTRRCSQAGDTLIEVLVAVVVVGLCGVALLLAFSTSITSTSEYRNLAAIDTVLRSVSENAVSQIQQQALPQFSSCATSAYYQNNVSLGAPAGYTATFTAVTYWTGSAFSTSCPAGSDAPQLLTITVKVPNGASDSNSFVVTYPTYSASAIGASPSSTSGI